MKTIKDAFKHVTGLLGEQDISIGSEYRPISFCALVSGDGYRAAYNSLTGVLLLLDEAEFTILNSEKVVADDSTDWFIKNWFLVPVAHDDMQLRNEIVDFIRTINVSDGKLRTYTIFTTTDCNARCFYCFEKGRKYLHMSDEIAEDAAVYILRTCMDKINLSWFGGEPLYNDSAIDIITDRVRAAGIEFNSTMVSNAYLFDDEIVKRAVEKWNLKRVQVTLDGTEEVYNKVKAYIYNDGRSPYKVVLDNIDRLLDAGISVNVRLNMDNYNYENLKLLIDELYNRFGSEKKFAIYSNMLFEISSQPGSCRSEIERKELEQKWMDLEERIFKLGKRHIKALPSSISLNQCMADSENAVTILPDGHLGKCEHHTEDRFIGDIYSGITNTNEVELFKVRVDSAPICKGCKIYPSCVRIKECTTLKISGMCDESTRYHREKMLYQSIAKYVEDYISKSE